MKVITHNTAIMLFEKAEALSQQPHESWKCVYFEVPGQRERRNHALYSNFVVKAVTDMLAQTDGTIYFCDDKEIFILFQCAFKPVLAKLTRHFGDIDPRPDGQQSAFSVFDLSKDWKDFYALCETRYLSAIAAREESRAHFTHQPYSAPGLTQRAQQA